MTTPDIAKECPPFSSSYNRESVTMKSEILNIGGMTCGGCVGTIERVLRAVEGVSSAKVSLADHNATVQFSEEKTTCEQLRFAIESAGYSVERLGRVPTAQAKDGCSS